MLNKKMCILFLYTSVAACVCICVQVCAGVCVHMDLRVGLWPGLQTRDRVPLRGLRRGLGPRVLRAQCLSPHRSAALCACTRWPPWPAGALALAHKCPSMVQPQGPQCTPVPCSWVALEGWGCPPRGGAGTPTQAPAACRASSQGSGHHPWVGQQWYRSPLGDNLPLTCLTNT